MKVYYSSAALIIAWLAVLGCIQAVTLEVKEGNSTCIKAELSASFSITYNTSSSTRTVQFPLPDSTTVDTASSSCGTEESSPVANLTLQYNLSDTSTFPDANSSVVITVVSASVGISATRNTTYHCVSPSTFAVGGATVTFSDMRLEAKHMQGRSDQHYSSTYHCRNNNNRSSSPHPPGTPERGSYFVNNGNGTLCLMAQMGLQLNFTYFSRSQNKTVQELLNLTPNLTTSSGSCEASSASLVLTQGQITTLNFTFTLNSTSKKYHLSGITLLADRADATAPISASNSSLDYLRSTLGRSYMCNAEQTLAVVPSFSLNTFRLQVQPFQVTTDQFDTAEECQMDQDLMLIPIIVGAALAGLVLIVLIAYLIGRKRSHAGYQTI
ncbi:Lysosome-associated membrane glycoprotein 1 [Dissostichus eleginoides]|uniref:Lysosome-associated membrane glycoprotein 1 n=1 Tax=Dissostichus eleginoides TaxID=100907 RepID=A0AAD9BYS2_DISEL|nr:Lysosome-associated membrane glycoprotein 1 [Dissostichus eleginoides]